MIGGICDVMDIPTRVLTTLNHEEPDMVPTFESTFTNNTIAKALGMKSLKLGPLFNLLRFLPLHNQILQWGSTRQKIMESGLITLSTLYRKAGIDIVPSVTTFYPRKLLKNGFIDEFGRHMQMEYAQDGTEIFGYVGGTFKDFEDYEQWEQPNPMWPARIAGFMAGKTAQLKMKDQIFSMPTTTGLMECTWEGFGFETFARILVKHKQIQRVFDDRGKFTLEMVKQLAERDAKVVLIFDDYAFKNGPMMSPRHYRQYVLPWIKQICAAAHKLDCKIMLHSDGDLTSILDDLVNDCQIDALNPIEPTIANPEYEISKIRAKYGHKLTLVGNVPPNLLATGTPEEVATYTKRLLQEIAPGGGYILASGHSINPLVTLEGWNAMIQTRNTYGKYPIQRTS